MRNCFSVLHGPDTLASRAIRIALQLRQPLYDCLYLACAERIRGRLVTADQRLLAAIDHTEFAALAVHVVAF